MRQARGAKKIILNGLTSGALKPLISKGPFTFDQDRGWLSYLES